MFERYTEKLRRVIFFSLHEASQFGAKAIEPEHILLGLVREDEKLVQRFVGGSASALESVRKEMEERMPLSEKVDPSDRLPLSTDSKRVLSYAADESERLNDLKIRTEHLLLGILRDKKSIAAETLYERGLTLNQVRDQVMRAQQTRRVQ